MSTFVEQRFAVRFTLGALSLFGMLSVGACFNDSLDSSGAANQSCPLGAVGCFCKPDGGCDGGLVCVSDRCVDLNLTSEQASSASNATSTASSGTPSTPSDAATSTSNAEASSDKAGSDTEATSDSSKKDATSKPEDPGSSEPEVSCKDDKKNGQESDVDCGGPDCTGCQVGQSCNVATDCRSGNCEAGTCAKAVLTCESDADCDDKNPCTQDRCTANKRCESSAAPEGTRCNDADACTRSDKCVQGRCEGVDTRVFREDFSKSPHGFLNGDSAEFQNWEIGPAVASRCAVEGFVEDPGQDHTQDGANGVMGVLIGGCQAGRTNNFVDCAWSDFVDVSGFESDVLFSYWRHLSSPGRDPMNPPIVPIVTNSIFYRVPGGSPVLMEKGWSKPVNDTKWTYIEHRVSSVGLDKVAFGICYKRMGSRGQYAGWTLDDVRVRQFGCEMNETK